MNNFIKKIWDKETDESVHSQFIKFSKGEFPDRAMIRAKNSKGNYTITTTSEYAKEIIMYLAEQLGDEKVSVSGALISALDLEGFEYDERKMAMGIRKYMIYDKEMSGNEILELCNKIDKAFFGLSFKTDKTDLTIKPKSPKSAKGSGSKKKGDAKAKIDFIKIKTPDEGLIKNLIFDDEARGFKKIEIKHNIIFDKIIMPETDEKDFAKIREMAKRAGKIERVLDIDGKILRKEIDFEA